jgi:putative flippase GtrA
VSAAERAEARLFIGFAVVGAVGFAADAGVFAAGTAAGLSPVLAKAISAAAALHVTFLLNGRFVFAALSARKLGRQWAGYMLSNGFGALVNLAIFTGLTASRLPYVSERWPAYAIAAALGLLVNYAGARLIAFRAPQSASEAVPEDAA